MEAGFYRALVEEISDIATIIDSDGKITYVSPAVEDVLGYDPEEMVGEVGYDYQHPDDRDTVAEAIEVIQTNPDKTKVIETRFRRADGSWCWIEATLQNRFADGDIDGILVNSRDISERKRQEQEQRELAQEYETLLQSVEDGIFFLTVDATEQPTEFRFERLNEAYEEQTGMTTEEMRGKTPTEVFGDELGAELNANYHRCLKAGEPVSYQEELPVETGARYWQTNLAPITTGETVTHIIGITRNVTERVERELKLQRHKTFLEHSPVAIAVIDEAGVVTYQSAGSQRAVGHPPEALIGEPVLEYIHPDDQDAIVDQFSRLAEDDADSHTAEYRFEDGAGNWRWLRSTASNYLDEQAIDGLVVATVDITEQKELEHRLEGQRDNLEVLNQALRHDIRNDLQLLLGHAEALDHRLEGDREHLDAILHSVNSAIDVTDRVKDVADLMLEAQTALHPVDLRNALTDAITDVRRSYEDALITTEGTIPAVEVSADELINSVFRNLITNAIEHNTSAVPEVTISVETGDEHVHVVVADNGPGISDERKGELFTEGQKGLDSTGTGLGLYLVESLVTGYGGAVQVADNEPAGAVFEVTVPIARSPPSD